MTDAMTPEKSLAHLTEQLDQMLATMLDNLEGSLIERGINDDEIAGMLENARRARATERKRILGLITGWLAHEGQNLQ